MLHGAGEPEVKIKLPLLAGFQVSDQYRSRQSGKYLSLESHIPYGVIHTGNGPVNIQRTPVIFRCISMLWLDNQAAHRLVRHTMIRGVQMLIGESLSLLVTIGKHQLGNLLQIRLERRVNIVLRASRSEERRVGKECRARWWG